MLNKKLFYKSAIYIIISTILFVLTISLSVGAFFAGDILKPKNIEDKDSLGILNYPYFKYKKYATNTPYSKDDIILTSENELYLVNRDIPADDPWHDYKKLYTGNLNKPSERKKIRYYKIGNGFYSRNIYYGGDYIYDKNNKKLYSASDRYVPHIAGNEVMNTYDFPGTSPNWVVKPIDGIAIWKRYNIYQKYDIVYYSNNYFYLFGNDFSVNKTPSILPTSIWKRIFDFDDNKVYNKYEIIKVYDKFYQARFDGVVGAAYNSTALWQEIYPRI